MPKFKLEILAPAWQELDEIATYHLQMVGANSARQITNKILDALERLECFPVSCTHVPDDELKSQDYRMLICGKYLCIYRLLGETIFVYHIVNAATEYSKLLKHQKL